MKSALLPPPPPPPRRQMPEWAKDAVMSGMIGINLMAALVVGLTAASQGGKAVLAASVVCLFAGACTGASLSFIVSNERLKAEKIRRREAMEDPEALPNTVMAAATVFLGFTLGGLPPFFAGFVSHWAARLATTFAASSVGLAVLAVLSALLGGQDHAAAIRSGARALVVAWIAMFATYELSQPLS